MAAFAVLYGLIRALLIFDRRAFLDLSLSNANFLAAIVVLLVASVSLAGIGIMTAVLPLISPRRRAQLGFVAQASSLSSLASTIRVSVLPD
jgi:ABC-2 type transport system permease protein